MAVALPGGSTNEGCRLVKFPVKTGRSLLATTAALLLGGCAHKAGDLYDSGIYVTRSSCPQLAIPAETGDITLFNPAGYTTASAIDVSATITNLRANCTDSGSQLVSVATFDVVATRRDVSSARTVVLPFFDVAMQGGSTVVAKRIGQVGLTFAAGQSRAATRGQGTISVSRAAVTLPASVRKELTRERKPGDADAAIDPLSNPTVRDAVARATFEHLIGFQLTQEQLRYNATR